MSDLSWGELHKHAQHDQKAHGNWAKKLLKPFSSGSNPKSRRKGEPEEWTGYEATSSLPTSSTILSQKGKEGEAITVSLERWLKEAPIGSTLHMNRDERKPVVYTITESGPVKRKKTMSKSWNELHKHANHDQKSHGSWANGRGGGSGGSTYVSNQEKEYKKTKFSNSPAGYQKMKDMQEQFSRALDVDGGLYQRGERESIQRAIDDLDSRMAPKWSRSDMKSIVDNKQAKTIDGVLVDMQTANLLSQITDRVDLASREWLQSLPVGEAATRAWKTQGKKR